MAATRRVLRGIAFDMDGTLTGDLVVTNVLLADHLYIAEHFLCACRHSCVMPGCHKCLAALHLACLLMPKGSHFEDCAASDLHSFHLLHVRKHLFKQMDLGIVCSHCLHLPEIDASVGCGAVPCIDFKLMRERAGVLKGDILEVVAAMEPAAKKRALDAIWDVEQQVHSPRLLAYIDRR